RTALVARRHHHIQHQPQTAHPIGVERMARTAWLVRVVPHLCPLLLAEKRLDRRVDVQDARSIPERSGRLHGLESLLRDCSHAMNCLMSCSTRSANLPSERRIDRLTSMKSSAPSANSKRMSPTGSPDSQRMTRIGVVGKSIPGAVSAIQATAKAAATLF